MNLFNLTRPTAFRRFRAAVLTLSLPVLFGSCQKDEETAPLSQHQVILNPQDSTMVLVPAGYAVLGNTPDGWGNYELPSGQDTAWVDSFCIDRYEVSNREYADYLNSALAQGIIRVSNGDVKDLDDHLLIITSSHESRISYVGTPPSFFPKSGFELTPAVMVSWYGAAVFAQFYGQRLPTDPEWEKAARGVSDALGSLYGVGVGYPYPWGDQAPSPELANFGQPVGSGAGQVVTSYPQGMSWYGALNMAGNVMEWTATSIGSSYRVVRGGSYLSTSGDLRTGMRFQYDPNATFPSYGFRCVSNP